MKTRTMIAAAAAAALAAAIGGAVPAAAEGGVKAGVLRCDVQGNMSFVFGSSRNISCTFQPEATRPVEHYGGEIKKFGVDLGYVENGVIYWAVIAPTSDLGRGALAGQYAGGSRRRLRPRRQCADRRRQPVDRAPAGQRRGNEGHQRRRRHRHPVALRAIEAVSPAAN